MSEGNIFPETAHTNTGDKTALSLANIFVTARGKNVGLDTARSEASLSRLNQTLPKNLQIRTFNTIGSLGPQKSDSPLTGSTFFLSPTSGSASGFESPLTLSRPTSPSQALLYKSGPKPFRIKLKEFRDAVTLYPFLLFCLLALFFTMWSVSRFSGRFSKMEQLAGEGIHIARGAAMALNLSCAIIILTMCKWWLTKIRAVSPKLVDRLFLDQNVLIHKWLGYSIVFFTVIHVVAHVFNYISISKSHSTQYLLSHPATITGIVSTVSLVLMSFTASRPTIRRKNYELFRYTHYLYIVFLAALFPHGAFCFVRTNDDLENDTFHECAIGGNFWRFAVVPLSLHLFELLMRSCYASVRHTLKSIQHFEDNVMELVFEKPLYWKSSFLWSQRMGQYICIKTPAISRFQWHPFTITSEVEADDITFMIKVNGDWTRKLKEVTIRENCEKIPFYFDGPFYSPTEDVFDYELSIIVGSGIGVTPFASVLHSLKYCLERNLPTGKLKHLHFVWTVRYGKNFGWFRELLREVRQVDQNGFHTIELFLTKTAFEDAEELKKFASADLASPVDTITGLHDRTRYGRPNFKKILQTTSSLYPPTTTGKVGVFCCGPQQMTEGLKLACLSETNANIRFKFYQEIFDT